MSATATTPCKAARPARGTRDVRCRRWAVLAWVTAALSVLAWGAWGLSYLVEWSTYTAGPVRAVAPRAGSPVVPAAGMAAVEERDETHVMLGRGGVFVYSVTVYTQSFAAPNADAKSRLLAWETLDTMFPAFPPWRFARFASGPNWGVRLWAVAVVPAALLVLCIVMRRRVAPEGACPRCRYSLAGLSEGGACPECGEVRRGVARTLAGGDPAR